MHTYGNVWSTLKVYAQHTAIYYEIVREHALLARKLPPGIALIYSWVSEWDNNECKWAEPPIPLRASKRQGAAREAQGLQETSWPQPTAADQGAFAEPPILQNAGKYKGMKLADHSKWVNVNEWV